MDDESRERADVATRAAEAGAAIALERFRTRQEVERKKAKTDVVTQADRDAQVAVADRIQAAFPDDPIVGEEDDELKAVPDEGPAWIVDPIDGTSNYVRGDRTFCTAVAAVVDGEPVAGTTVFPALGDRHRSGPDGASRNDDEISVSDRSDPEACLVCPTNWWDHDRRNEFAAAGREIVERFGDLRRYGCGQAELAAVATGAFDAVVTNVRGHPWDTVAGVHLIRQAGGTVTDLEGERWRHDSRGLVASNGRIHEDALSAARAIDG